MVHALAEVRRVLTPSGFLIDLRPLLSRWEVEVASARERLIVGRVQDSSVGVEDDEAANQAMAESEARGWFVRESYESFPYIYSWDSPTEMEEWLGDEWDGFIELDDDLRKATRSAWALADGDARVQLRMKLIISRWRVVK